MATVSREIKELYDGKINFKVNRFRTAFAAREGQSTWIIQILDVEDNIAREHYFTNLNDVNIVTAFLKKNQMLNV